MLNPETNPYRNIKPIWTVFDTTELDAYVILYKCLYVSHLFLLSYNILQAVCSKFKLYITMLSYSVQHTLSVLFWFMGSDCPFGILKLVLLSVVMLILSSYKSMQDNVLQQHVQTLHYNAYGSYICKNYFTHSFR
jgi:hypothetical protein